MNTIDPDQCATAARRLAAKMVADQAVPLMVSYVGMTGDVDEDVRRIADGETPILILARGKGAVRVLGWLEDTCGPKPVSIEVEPARPRSDT